MAIEQVWPREPIIELIREWAADGGDMRISSYREWARDREAPCDVTISRRFGSWRELVRAAGFDPVGRPGFDGAYRRSRSRS